MTQSLWEKRVEHFARCRAHCRQAVNDIYNKRSNGDLQYFASDENNKWLGPTYMEIRFWIQERFRYWQENVQGRCKEDYDKYLRKETDDNGRVHVFPLEAGVSGRQNTQ